MILGGDYDESADLWSLACMIFELVTGDYLFDPKKGKSFRKNDDHLALISELIGPCRDKRWLESCSKYPKFYDKKKKVPQLKNISKLKVWPLYNVLVEKYRLKPSEANELAHFLGMMLQWRPKDRATARSMLKHPFLKMDDNYNVWMTKDYLKEYVQVNKAQFPEAEKVSEDSKSGSAGSSGSASTPYESGRSEESSEEEASSS